MVLDTAVLIDLATVGMGAYADARLYGVLLTLVRATGRNPRPRCLDLQVAAATAPAARLPLLTCHPADFVGVDRLVVDIGRGVPRLTRPRRPSRSAPCCRAWRTGGDCCSRW